MCEVYQTATVALSLMTTGMCVLTVSMGLKRSKKARVWIYAIKNGFSWVATTKPHAPTYAEKNRLREAKELFEQELDATELLEKWNRHNGDETDRKALRALLFVGAIVLASMVDIARGAGPVRPVVCDEPEASGVLRVLCSFQVHSSDRDEHPEERGERLVGTEVSVMEATSDQAEQSWLLMMARRESHLARFVDYDWPKCAKGEGGWCDGGRAFSFWQLHGTNRDLTRTQAAELALKTFRSRARYCKARGYDYWVGGTSLYASGTTCKWPEAEDRVAEMWRIFGRLQ